MDDFGTGYSSLNMLKDVHLDTLKLDKEFFKNKSMDSARALIIVKRLIELAKDLGMTVVAEGVETRDSVEFLKSQGCDIIQGYYYSRPVVDAEIIEKLKK